MLVGLDSATPPNNAQALAAKASGVRLWSGYLGRPNVGLYHPWTRANFEAARLCGSTPIAFCSGWDDPIVCKAQAALWNVRLCLDVEGGIRGNGPWVQSWLIASGAGLYGNAPVHAGRKAPFHVLAAYPYDANGRPLDPRATWSGSRPAGPCGWQWHGTHTEVGVGVDRGWYDDWFQSTYGPDPGNLPGDDMSAATEQLIYRIFFMLADPTTTDPATSKANEPWSGQVWERLNKIDSEIKAISAVGGVTDLTPVLAAIADLKAHPAVVSDPTLAAKIDALGKHLGIGIP